MCIFKVLNSKFTHFDTIDQDPDPSHFEQDENFKPRKRLRKEQSRKAFVMHQKVQKGMERYSRSGNLIVATRFQPQQICLCRMNCHTKIDVDQQHALFRSYYDLPDWTKKTLYLRSSVERNPVTRKVSDLNPIHQQKDRNYTYHYFLHDDSGIKQQVCNNFFYKCLQVNSKRVYRAIDTLKSNPTAKDHRGIQPPKNKTNERDELYVKEFIAKFPKYKSHYGRNDSNREYLPPHLNIRKMYREYVAVTEFRQRTVLKESMFREIFNTEFNLAFKKPKTDTCKTCDEISAKNKSGNLSSEEMQSLEKRKLDHHQSVKEKKTQFEKDLSDAKNSMGKLQCYTFDLQKTLETPSLSTNVAYYRRQLWTLNLCVYDEVNEKGYMYMWSENVASRGANEIGSCLIKHMNNFLPENTEEIILYSDSCGGQNRNIKMSMILKKILTSLVTVKTITQKFFISGHSYNSCDRCFGVIEKQKKATQDIYVPSHWQNIVRTAKKKDPKFEVVLMTGADFYSSQKLLDLIVNRKITSDHEKVNWHKIESNKYIKDKPFVMFIKQFQSDVEVKVNLHKKDVLERVFVDVKLENLPEPKISKEKYDDLISLLQYIPPEHHEFFKNIQHNGAPVGDYSLADSSDEE